MKKIKKILLIAGIGFVVLIVLGILAVSLFLDGAVKRGVETFGPQLTGVTIQLDHVGLSLLSGSGTVKGLVIGNPEGYKTPHSISVSNATLALKPASLLADKIVITKLEVVAPEITFEGGLHGNNLSKILANLDKATGSSDTNTAAGKAEKPSPGKKLEVDDFVIRGAKVQLFLSGLGGESVTVAIPDTHLSNLGTGPEGITAAELSKQVLAAIEQAAVKAASSKGVSDLTKGVTKAVGENANKLGQKLGDLLKKK